MKIQILPPARQDLVDGFEFYERQQPGVGQYFLDSLYSDIDSLQVHAGIHPKRFANYQRMLSKRFPFAVYYRVEQDILEVHRKKLTTHGETQGERSEVHRNADPRRGKAQEHSDGRAPVDH